jgi:hypothetical protein
VNAPLATVVAGLVTLLLGCGQPTRLVGSTPPRHPRADALSSLPGFIVIPAQDARPQAEREGSGVELGFMMASSGGGMSHGAGAEVLAADDDLAWDAQPFPAQQPSLATALAADLGSSLDASAGRPVRYAAASLDGGADGAADGAVVVGIVVDHLTRLTPSNFDHSQTTSQQGNYEVTTTITNTERLGPFWTFTFRVQLGEVRGGRIVRRQVRYVSTTSATTDGYGDAVNLAASAVVDAVTSDWLAAASTSDIEVIQ